MPATPNDLFSAIKGRDRDRVLAYKLLRLLKQQKCRIRTPEGVYNPAVPRDWDYLADDIEDSAEEMKKMGIYGNCFK